MSDDAGECAELFCLSWINRKKNATFSVLSCLSNYLAKLVNTISCTNLFSSPPTIGFSTKEDCCNHCHSSLKVRKTYPRKVVTFHIGTFYARNTSSICPKCRRIYQSEELATLVAPGANFGYDILVYVGKTSIEELFAEIEITRLRQELKKAQQNPEKIPAKIQPHFAPIVMLYTLALNKDRLHL